MVFAVKEALFDLLEEKLADDPAVPVVWGLASTEPVAVAIWEGSDSTDERLVGPPVKPLDQDFEVQLLITVIHRPSKSTMRTAEKEAWEIHQRVVEAIRASSELDGTCRSIRPARSTQEWVQADRAIGCAIRLTLAGTARI